MNWFTELIKIQWYKFHHIDRKLKWIPHSLPFIKCFYYFWFYYSIWIMSLSEALKAIFSKRDHHLQMSIITNIFPLFKIPKFLLAARILRIKNKKEKNIICILFHILVSRQSDLCTWWQELVGKDFSFHIRWNYANKTYFPINSSFFFFFLFLHFIWSDALNNFMSVFLEHIRFM